MTGEEIKKYYSFYCRVWKFFKKYANKEINDNFWADMIAEGEDIQKEFGNTDFTKRTVVQAILEMERIRGDNR